MPSEGTKRKAAPLTDDLYLILHIAHGEPTLDIARRTEIAKEEAFIITGGFRAYPYWTGKDWPPDIPMPLNHPWLFVGMNYPGAKTAKDPEPWD